MSKPYLLYSDVHLHEWSAFASLSPSGFNSRLDATLNELRRAYDEIRKVKGIHAICGGDLFHVRGRITPTVLNPSRWFFNSVDDAETYCLSGNHDLASNDARGGHSMVEALEGDHFTAVNKSVVHEPANLVMIPWLSSIEKLKEEIVDQAGRLGTRLADYDLIIHAPIDGVLAGLPENGLSAEWLGEQGFKRVFAGHYHNFKDFGNNVYSIGALGHQTWSDVGSKAGFLIVHPDRVERFASHLPSFMDVPDCPEDELSSYIDGHYVRCTLTDPTTEQVAEARGLLETAGAAGVLMRSVTGGKKSSDRGTTTAMDSVEDSIFKYAKSVGDDDLAASCLDVYKTVTEAAA